MPWGVDLQQADCLAAFFLLNFFVLMIAANKCSRTSITQQFEASGTSFKTCWVSGEGGNKHVTRPPHAGSEQVPDHLRSEPALGKTQSLGF